MTVATDWNSHFIEKLREEIAQQEHLVRRMIVRGAPTQAAGCSAPDGGDVGASSFGSSAPLGILDFALGVDCIDHRFGQDVVLMSSRLTRTAFPRPVGIGA